jgi:hypothetical protein
MQNVGKSERIRPLRIFRHRWEDNIKINLKQIDLRIRAGFDPLRIGTSGGLL